MKKKYYKDIFDPFFVNSIDLLCIADNKGYFRRLNPEWERTLGYKLSELEGKKFIKFVHPDDIEKTNRTLQTALNQSIQNFTNRYRHKDGSYRWIEWRSFPSGEMIYGSARDITENIMNEQALKEGEERLRGFINESTNGIVILNDKGIIEEWNKPAEVITGITKEQADHHYWWDIVLMILHPDLQTDLIKKKLEKKVRDTFKTGKIKKATSETFPMQHPGGRIKYIEHDLFTFKTGTRYQVAVILTDITERKRMEESLRESEDKFRVLADQSPNMIFINQRGKVIYANKACEKVTGYTIEEFYSDKFNFRSLIDEEYQAAISENFRKHLAGQDVPSIEYRIVCKNREKLDVIINTKLITYQNEKVILGIVTDISKRKRMEESLKESEELLRGINQNIPGIVYQLSLGSNNKFKVNYVSDNTIKYTGLDSHDPDLLQHFINGLAHEDRARFVDSRQKAIKNKSTWEWEGKYISPEGVEKYFHWLSQPRMVKNELVYDGVIIDNTERKEAELKFKQLAGLNQTILETITVGLAYVIGRKLQWSNSVFYKMFGYEYEEIIDDSTAKFYKDEELFLRIGKEAYSQFTRGETYSTEAQAKRKDGSLFWVSLSCKALNPEKPMEGSIWMVEDITDRKLAEEKSRQLADLNQTLLDTVTAGLIFVKDRNIQWINEVCARMFGYEYNEIIGAETSVLYESQEFYEKVGDEGYPYLVTGKPYSIKMHGKRKNGSSFPCLVTGKAVNPEDLSEGSLWMIQDITEQKEAEEALKKSEEKFRGITQNIPGLVYQFYARENDEYGIYYASDNSLQLLGLDNRNLEGFFELFLEGIPKEDRKGFLDSIKAVVESKSPWIYEGRYNKPEGEEIYFRGVSQPRLLENEIVFDGIIFDITKSKLAETELAYTKALLTTAIMQTPIPMIIVSAQDYIIRFGNNAAKEILGIQDESGYIGKSLLEIQQTWQEYDENEKPVPITEMPLALALRGVETKNKEYYLIREDGSVRWETASASTIRNEAGEIIAAYVIFPDITERKNAEVALRKSESILKATIESIDDGVLVVLQGGIITQINTCYKRLFSIPDDTAYQNDDAMLTDYIKQQLTEPKQFTKRIQEIYQTTSPSEDILHFIDGRILERRSFSLSEDSPVQGRVWLYRDITERKKSEEALSRSQKLLSDSQRIAHIGCWENDLKANKIIWNEEAYEIFGYKNQEIELTFQTFANCLHPEDQEFVRRHFKDSVEKKEFTDFECRIIRPDGAVRTAVNVGAVSLDENDNPVRLFGIVQDITERKKAEEEIRLSEQKFRSIFDNSTVGVALVDLTGKYLMVNNALCKIYGYSSEELATLDIYQLTHPDDIELSSNTIRKMIDSEHKEFSFSKRYIHKDGRTIWADIASRLIYDNDNNPLYFITHVKDITDRKLAEEKLRVSEEKMLSIFRVAPTGIGVVKNRIITDLNQYICDMTGYTKEELIGNDARLLYPTQEEYDFVGTEKYHQIAAKGTGSVETKWKAKDHSIIDIVLSSTPIDVHDQSKGVIFTALDITERKKAEEEIKRLNASLEKKVEERTIKLNEAVKDLESFAYSISHDLRAPLRHINGFVKLMFSKLNQPDETVIDYYRKVEAATMRMSAMIDSLLSFSRLGRKELTLSTVDIRELVEEIIEQFKPDIGERLIEWHVTALPRIRGDKSLLKLAFGNLISNAIKYTSKKEKAIIRIGSGKQADNRVEIFIRDNGVGYDMAYANKLFGVFQRLHTAKEFEGIGIGLANARQIIEKHNGTIRTNAEVDKGAVFYISLPNN